MDSASSSATPVSPATTEDKTVAILSYLTLIGFIVAIIIHSSKKTKLGAFHLRQALGLILTSIAVGVAATVCAFIPFVGWIAAFAAWIGVIVLWVMGLVAAINGELKPMPVLGEAYQKWFGTAFD
jgi:uncharacterized membrane protein